MIRAHALGNSMDVPVERLRFDPDPLAITSDRNGECQCFVCRARRAIAAAHGVPVEAVTIVGASLLPDTTLLDKQPPALVSSANTAAEQAPAAPIPAIPSAPQITAFDVHGCRPEPAATDPESFAAPTWLIRCLEICGRLVGWCAAWFYLLVLAPRRVRDLAFCKEGRESRG